MTETAVPGADETAGAPQADAYARGARILSIGIASTGVFTFAYFAVASHVLDANAYGAVSLLWAVLFVVISVIYRPVEQLLSRTIADRRARGHHDQHPLRIPLLVQAGFATAFLVVALALKGPIEDAFDSTTLYWVFVGATLAYAASYFARGYLAGHQWFGLYGGLVLFESVSRFCFPVAVAVALTVSTDALSSACSASWIAATEAAKPAPARSVSARSSTTAGVSAEECLTIAHGTTSREATGAARMPRATADCPLARPTATATGKQKRDTDSKSTRPP